MSFWLYTRMSHVIVVFLHKRSDDVILSFVFYICRYNELHVEDVHTTLEREPLGGVDLLISADTFIYVGEKLLKYAEMFFFCVKQQAKWLEDCSKLSSIQ